MFNLSAFQHPPDLPKLLERIRLGESKMILHLFPPAEQHIFLIFPFLVNPPPTSVRERRRIRSKVRYPFFENGLEFILVTCLDKIPAYSNDRCVQWDRRGSRLEMISQILIRC